MEFIIELVRRYVVVVNKVGVKYILIVELILVILSKDRFDEFIVKNLNKIYNEFDCWKGMYICGDIRELLDNMLSCNIDVVSLD